VGANVHSYQATPGDVERASLQLNGTLSVIGLRQATGVELIWEQEAAGSNPAIPT
jgi:hypothetical protein